MNDELNKKMREAMAEQFPWVRDLPLTKEILRIMKDAGESDVDKLTAAAMCAHAAKKSILPHVETTELTNVCVIAALASIAEDIKKHLDSTERGAADELANIMRGLDDATVIATYVKRSEIFGDEKK